MSSSITPEYGTPEDAVKGPLLSNRQYDVIKQLVQKGLPAAGALYAGLAIIWGFPNGEEVVGSIALITTFLGVLMGVSNKSFEASGAKYDGALVVDTSDPLKDIYRFEANIPFEDMAAKSHLTLKVKTPD